MKKLAKLLTNIEPIRIRGDLDMPIESVEFDSRRVTKNSAFVAMAGTNTDGHRFISQAIQNGATALIVERWQEDINAQNLTIVIVKDSRRAFASLAANFFDHPSKKLSLIGVTGTNGKTTIATLLYQLFQKLGLKCGLLSTIENYVDTRPSPTTHTTLDSFSVNRLLYEMLQAGCTYCFMEVSSHAIQQKRIEGLHFRVGVFTNISHDHLDYHKTFKNYLNTKKHFFDKLPETAFVLSNADDKNGKFITQNTQAKPYYYSLQTIEDFTSQIIEEHVDSTIIELENTPLTTYFIGKFNISNLLAVYAVTQIMGLEKERTLQAISTLKPIRGRYETIVLINQVRAIIDYAHTPDALKNILQSIRELRKNGEKIITVVGAGGNRDKEKRPKIGNIVAKLSDRVILTSDNPRDENPEMIIQDIRKGIEKSDLIKVITNMNRREAIHTACLLACRGDIILIAGKGHETYQEIRGVKNHFDDKEVILQCINV